MGLTANVIAFQEKIIQKVGFHWQKVRMCELGAMCMRTMNDIPAKKYYIEEKKVLEHVSIDWNGMFGSLPIDLSFPVPKELLNKFNLVTDYGTIEHVDNQYQVFKNVHDVCSMNGVIIHTLPTLNYWKDHCKYFYSKEFFVELARLCDYKILDLEIKSAYNVFAPKSKLVFIALLKKNNNEFISEREFNKLKIFDFSDLNNTFSYYLEKIIWKLWSLRYYILNYPNKNLKRIFRKIINKLIRST